MNQSKHDVNIRHWREARENVCEWVTIGFGFNSDWMKKWREFPQKPIVERRNAEPQQMWIIITLTTYMYQYLVFLFLFRTAVRIANTINPEKNHKYNRKHLVIYQPGTSLSKIAFWLTIFVLILNIDIESEEQAAKHIEVCYTLDSVLCIQYGKHSHSHNHGNFSSKGERCNKVNPMWSTNLWDKAIPQHRELRAQLFSTSVWEL